MLVIQKPPGTNYKAVNDTMTYVKTGTATFFDEAYGHMNGDYTNVHQANLVHNTYYATNGPHPSDDLIAYNNGLGVWMDQVTLIGAATSTSAKVLESITHAKEWTKRGVGSDGGGHHFGYGTCFWIRACTSSEKVGSPCQGTLSNVVHKGFCFLSDTMSLECGKMTATDDEYGEKPISFDLAISPNLLPSVAGVVNTEDHGTPTTQVVPANPGVAGTVYRCPTFSPAKSLGAFVSKRPLNAGCMITSDASYDQFAEVHVPAYCTTPTDYKKGCMSPSALNFSPDAKQTDTCKFPTSGCSSATAVNYNSYATVDDGTCIQRVTGCSVTAATYHNVNTGTPAYKSGWYGSVAAGSGGWPNRKATQLDSATNPGFTGTTVVQQTPNANVNTNCIAAVEGCMDPTARNYDSKATVNSNTWCVPDVRGCMIPDPARAGSITTGTMTLSTMTSTIGGVTTTYSGGSWTPDGKVNSLGGTFATTITRNDPSMCGHTKFGCVNDTTAYNYDREATVQTLCYSRRIGCLNPNAVNYLCPSDLPNAPCTDLVGSDRVTFHIRGICKWTATLLASPPPPPAPTDLGTVDVKHKVKTVLVVAGTVVEISAKEAQFIATYRTLGGFGPDVTILFSVTAASRRRRLADTGGVNVELTAEVASAEAATAATSTVSAAVGTTGSAATAAFSSVGVTVLAAPKVEAEVEYVLRSDAGAMGAGGLIGGIAGGIVGVLLVLGVVYFVYKRGLCKKKPVYPA